MQRHVGKGVGEEEKMDLRGELRIESPRSQQAGKSKEGEKRLAS